MSDGLTIPADVLERALEQAALKHLESVDVEAITHVDTKTAAKLLSIPPRVFRKLALDYVDFGELRRRWSLKEIKQLVEARKVRARKSQTSQRS